MSFDSLYRDTDDDLSSQIVSLTFFRFHGFGTKLWAFGQMALARRPLAMLPDHGFFKLMGGGTGEGFTPIPDTGLIAVLTTWPDLQTARQRTETAPVFQRLAHRATEVWTIHLSPVHSRGAWSRKMPFHEAPSNGSGPIAALTRASIRPAILFQFWRRVPDISAAIGSDPNVLFKQGVGEVPWFHQVTFSVWPDTRSMAAFARAGGPHAQAIRAVREGDWFSEELYARFAVVATAGSWGGADPLAAYALTLAAE